MIPDWSQLNVARVTIELLTPLSIGSGVFDPLHDFPVVVDANELPTIPGTSLAGVLKRALPGCDEIFGDQEGCSRLDIGFACIHDQHGRVVEGLLLPVGWVAKDAILSPLVYAPVVRDRTSLDETGVADNMGKFDRCIVPGGYRFSFEMSLWGKDETDNADAWQALRECWQRSPPAIGGSTRNGLGRVCTKYWGESSFNLRDSVDFARFGRLPRGLNDDQGFFSMQAVPPAVNEGPGKEFPIPLRSTGPWRVGQGSKALSDGKQADRLPLTEEWVTWETRQDGKGECGRLQAVVVIPGSGVKGALRHRALFHYHRIRDWYAVNEKYTPLAKEHIDTLFGCIADGFGSSGAAGKVSIDDAHFSVNEKVCASAKSETRNAHDRLTQGGRHGHLFSEETLSRDMALDIRMFAEDISDVDPEVKQAFYLALRDLMEGNLALGAGSSIGHGFFEVRDCPDCLQRCAQWLGIEESQVV